MFKALKFNFKKMCSHIYPWDTGKVLFSELGQLLGFPSDFI